MPSFFKTINTMSTKTLNNANNGLLLQANNLSTPYANEPFICAAPLYPFIHTTKAIGQTIAAVGSVIAILFAAVAGEKGDCALLGNAALNYAEAAFSNVKNALFAIVSLFSRGFNTACPKEQTALGAGIDYTAQGVKGLYSSWTGVKTPTVDEVLFNQACSMG